MPDVQGDSSVLRRWRLPALLTGVALVSGATVLRSTLERRHGQVDEVQRLRARLAERRREVGRQRLEMAAVEKAVDRVMSAVQLLKSRVAEVGRRGGRPETPDTPHGSPGIAPSCIDEGAKSATIPAVARLVQAKEHILAAGDAFTLLDVAITERTRTARSVPTSWPVEGAVSSRFGWRASPYGGAREWHPGIDITAPYGTPVRATADGEVVFAGRAHGYGGLVVLDHGASQTRYAHLSAIRVHVGQSVLRGEPLGGLGGTGRATGPHLHYEVRLGDEPVDPECALSSPPRDMPANARRSGSCALVRARLEGRKPVTARDTAHATPANGGVAG